MRKLISTLKGFRDFLPKEKKRRDFVAKKLKETFEIFGFEPLETPTLEYASLLLGKYGEEAGKLIYSFKDRGERKVAMRYDQTVPTARVLAEYKDSLPKYFRRYQIQDVFRADKPQKGRYRQFVQCDIDIFGVNSSLADAEILATTYFALKNVGFTNVILKINDRRVLFEMIKKYKNRRVNVFSIIQSIDKLEKKGHQDVEEELIKKGLLEETAKEVLKVLEQAKISPYIERLIELAFSLGVPRKALQFSPSLARGLDYYTGMIFEITIMNYSVGSLGGGGRYDNLIGQISDIDVPAVGVGLGFDRIVEAASQSGLISDENDNPKVLITVFNERMIDNSLVVAHKLRIKGIKTEVYPALNKLSKQLRYANKIGASHVVVIGPEEKENNLISVKNLKKGLQEKMNLSRFISSLK